MTRRFFALFLALIIQLQSVASSLSDGRSLIELSRELQFNQAQSVVRGGDRGQIQRNLTAMSKTIQTLSFQDISSTQASAAIVLYLLGGGSPTLVEKQFGLRRLQGSHPVIAGVIAFSTGDRISALKHLGDVDPLILPASIGGHIALVQAMLQGEAEDSTKMHKLAIARLLLPGSIAEEVALRESAELSYASNRFDDLVFVVDQYFRRFPASIYAPAFSKRLGVFIGGLEQTRSEAAQQKLIEVFTHRNPHVSTQELLSFCRMLISSGQLNKAGNIAAEILTRASSELEQRQALLYLVVATPLTSDVEKHLTILRSSDLSDFTTSDRVLLRSVLKIRSGLSRMDTERAPKTNRPSVADNKDDEFIANVTRLLSQTR